MRKSLFVFNLVVVAALVLMETGCKSMNKKGAGGANGTGEEIPQDVVPVDAEGQPIAAGENFMETRTRLADVSFAPVYFGFDSFQLAPQEVSKIEAVAEHLQSNPAHVLVVEGHCDERGSNEYNLSLGEQRALSVRSYLVNLGIAENRVQTKSFGKEKPAVMGSGEDTWRLNRRGEFGVYK